MFAPVKQFFFYFFFAIYRNTEEIVVLGIRKMLLPITSSIQGSMLVKWCMNQFALGFLSWQRVPKSSAWFTAVACSDVGKFGDHLKQQPSHNLLWNTLSCLMFLWCIRWLNTAPSFMEGPKTCNSCKIEYWKLKNCSMKKPTLFSWGEIYEEVPNIAWVTSSFMAGL